MSVIHYINSLSLLLPLIFKLVVILFIDIVNFIKVFYTPFHFFSYKQNKYRKMNTTRRLNDELA